MTFKEVMTSLEAYGDANTKKTLIRHGAKEPFFGVKVGDLKKIQKKIKKDHALALELFDSGHSDAMYLAGLIEDVSQVTEEQLNDWINKAYWYYLSEYTVPWVASDSGHGQRMGLQWIESDEEKTAAAGWSTLSADLMVIPNDQLDIPQHEQLLERVENEIANAANRVRYTMNQFVIACGGGIPELTQKAIDIGKKIGKVEVNVGNTACKVPSSPEYIQKMIKMGRIGKKKKMARC